MLCWQAFGLGIHVEAALTNTTSLIIAVDQAAPHPIMHPTTLQKLLRDNSQNTSANLFMGPHLKSTYGQ